MFFDVVDVYVFKTFQGLLFQGPWREHAPISSLACRVARLIAITP